MRDFNEFVVGFTVLLEMVNNSGSTSPDEWILTLIFSLFIHFIYQSK
ncbi:MULTISPECIES: hypothetical protein [Vibrio]|jgi:hypothetical protein|nr:MULTISPECIES: hypothetical protein [Vibrio]ELB2827113.1 hypothetical protein [Vibrio parahaemolyticus]MBE3803199.1 hypothetical protein [Vibrio parahaemolyticus]MBE3830703.1 hypothetical protein [Vibrio parahaemolyticus]MBE3844916.1 hypothetical protein [Vibrio parahaemolyticus]MBE3986240.1 hypothetical protein [Vibrio parahaemolyticus]